MSVFDNGGWSRLPQHILVSIFSYLPQHHRSKAAQACQAWNEAFQSPYLWKHFTFQFYEEKDQRYLECVRQYSQYLRSVVIELDQHEKGNRENALEVLNLLTICKERRLSKIKLTFTGENPYFYAGKEFLDALILLFKVPEDTKVPTQILDIDLGGLTISIDDSLLNNLSEHQTGLQRLNIQNKVLVSKITPNGVLHMLQKCRKLKELHLFYNSVSEEILQALMEPERAPLEMLSLKCRRYEKYGKDIEDEVWGTIHKSLPNFRVCLAFDHTCPIHKVTEIMKPSIPVSVLRLETFTYIYDELRIATSYYHKTLETLVLQTPLSKNSQELNSALIDHAKKCSLLRKMHVYCILDEPTVNEILKLRPELKPGSYTLKFKSDS